MVCTNTDWSFQSCSGGFYFLFFLAQRHSSSVGTGRRNLSVRPGPDPHQCCQHQVRPSDQDLSSVLCLVTSQWSLHQVWFFLLPGRSLWSWWWTCLNPTPCGPRWRSCCRPHELSWKRCSHRFTRNKRPRTRRLWVQQLGFCLKIIRWDHSSIAVNVKVVIIGVIISPGVWFFISLHHSFWLCSLCSTGQRTDPSVSCSSAHHWQQIRPVSGKDDPESSCVSESESDVWTVWSVFQEMDSDTKRVVSKTLRFLSHFYAASLIVRTHWL